ncbi:MAG: HK97 family phage prohead protease [Bryobacterales bacterium]|nr:HK97 family phage prohead protease [Bryobacterales bacterium]MDE0293698.1 HK97 family phage prohead protease [Bryobacterales bacterium]
MDEIRCSVNYLPDETRQGPGRLVGRLLSYGEQIVHGQGRETFESRSLTFGDDGIVFYDSHDVTPRRPVAIVHPENRDTEAVVDFVLPDTGAGRRVAKRFREGSYKGLSIEFRSVREKYVAGVRRISEALVNGFAAVESPAYPSAQVEVRSKRKQRNPYSWR